MTNPTQILTEKRARIAELESALEVERAELRGMEVMAALLNSAPAKGGTTPSRAQSADSAGDGSSKGRQPGSISMRWRAVLWRLDRLGGDFSASDIVSVVQELEKRNMRPTGARRQMDIYADLGFIVCDGGKYNVTDEFRTKFVDSADTGAAVRTGDMLGDVAPEKIEASAADVADASEIALHALDRRPQE